MRAVRLACPGMGIATAFAAHGQVPERAVAAQAAPARLPFNVVEASIPDLRRAMEEGRAIVQQQLLQMVLYEDWLNAIIEWPPKMPIRARSATSTLRLAIR